ncbi:MAG: aminotransferase class III-fold pyridoxal phosphate-dependent enzyme [archaeon]
MGKTEGIIRRDKRVISPSFARSSPVVFEKGKGCYLWDVEGKKYLDFQSSVTVCGVGYQNPDVKAAIRSQLDKLMNCNFPDYYSELPVKVAEKLVTKVPIPGQKKVFFANSGTECVECALKLARWHTGKTNLIGFYGDFHGRSYGAVSLTCSKKLQHQGFEPLLPGVKHSHFAYCYRCPLNLEYPGCGVACADYLEEVVLTDSPPENTAGLIFEPIQGEGGYIVPPKEFLPRVQKICNRNKVLFISDEVQTGLCRTGRWSASEVFKIKPDVVLLSKSIANGMPFGAVIAKEKYMRWPSGSHSNTFGGNALASAASLAVINYMEKKRLWKNSEQVGKFAMERLERMKEKYPIIGDVRGKGLMIGVEFIKDRKKTPAVKERDKIVKTAVLEGLILLGCGKSVIRIAPPLTITEAEMEKGLNLFEKACKSVRTS